MIGKRKTNHKAADDVAASKAVADFYSVLFCCPHILRANNASKLFSYRKGYTIDDRY